MDGSPRESGESEVERMKSRSLKSEGGVPNARRETKSELDEWE